MIWWLGFPRLSELRRDKTNRFSCTAASLILSTDQRTMTLPAVVSPHLKFSTGDFHMDIHLSTLILRPRTGQPRTTSVRIAALRIAALWLCMATVTVAAIFADELPLRDSARTETPIAEHWAVGESTIQEPVASGEISLFDGTTLNGWSGDPRYWTVENGAITGTTTAEQPLDANSFLIWRDGEVAGPLDVVTLVRRSQAFSSAAPLAVLSNTHQTWPFGMFRTVSASRAM